MVQRSDKLTSDPAATVSGDRRYPLTATWQDKRASLEEELRVNNGYHCSFGTERAALGRYYQGVVGRAALAVVLHVSTTSGGQGVMCDMAYGTSAVMCSAFDAAA